MTDEKTVPWDATIAFFNTNSRNVTDPRILGFPEDKHRFFSRLPIPLRVQPNAAQPGHFGAETIGTVLNAWINGSKLKASGNILKSETHYIAEGYKPQIDVLIGETTTSAVQLLAVTLGLNPMWNEVNIELSSSRQH